MAPRKTAAAGEDGGCPALKLIMEKGPLSGQTIDFRPGFLIHIGRLVRGNTISIKDAGISSKHLLIQSDAVSDAGRRLWTVTDLDSSNGTVLNGSQLKPSEPAVLSDGDIIKFGAQTSIKVKFEGHEVLNEVSSGNVRRNARRRVRNRVGDLGVIEEDSELGFGNNEDGEKNDYVAEVEVKQGRNVSTRRTRSSKKNEGVLEDLNLNMKQDLTVINEDSELGLGNKEGEKIDMVAAVEVKGGRNMSMRSKSSTKNDINLNLENDKDLGPSRVKESRGVRMMRTRSSRKDENVDEIGIDLSVIQGKKTRKGTRGRKKLPVENLPEETEKEERKSEHKTYEEEKSRSEAEVKEFADGKNNGRDGSAAGLASTSWAKESNVGSDNGNMVSDLEKMTLGEWFNFLEVCLPKQIIDETEEMISEMKKKAEMFHEFMLQQKNAKSK